MCKISRMVHEVMPTRKDGAYIIGATGMTAICQNLRVILATLTFSVPLDRAFAHAGRLIDSPAPNDAARLAVDLVEAIERYEPRIRVEKLEFAYVDRKDQLMEGQLTPKVTFSLREGVEL